MTAAPKPRLSRAVLEERLPGYIAQAVLLVIVGWLVWRGALNFQANARALGLSAGFDFLRTQAGFEIAQSLIAFTPASPYLDAIIVATLNTLLVVALASLLSTLIALFIAFGRLASGTLVRGASSAYVEVFRNIPLLLQILFWYFSAIALLPAVSESIQLGPALLNNRGLFLPSLQLDPQLALDRPHVDGFDVGGGRNRGLERRACRAAHRPAASAAGRPAGRGRAIPDARQGVVACCGDRLSGHHADRWRHRREPDQSGARSDGSGGPALRRHQLMHRHDRGYRESPSSGARGPLSRDRGSSMQRRLRSHSAATTWSRTSYARH